MFAETHHTTLRAVPDQRRPMFDQPFRIAHIRDDNAYWTITGWGPKEQATVYAAEDRARVQLPEGGCWELIAPVPKPCVDYAWTRVKSELALNHPLATIAHVLNAVEAPQKALIERDLKDAERIIRLAKLAINCLDKDIVETAIDEVAHVIAEGPEGQYPPLETLSSVEQAMYHRWAQAAFTAARFVLEGVAR